MLKKTSLKDIAQAVGVSTALVSYVLNNQKENRISKAIAQQIRKVAQELNYQPNHIAKSLKTNKSRTLGLIVADIANPFSSSLARVIEDEADKHNYTVIIGSSDENPQKCQKLISALLNRQVDGLLIAAPEGAEPQLIDLQQKGLPFVLIDRYFPDLRTNYVALDNYQSIHNAVAHLVRGGYRRIGMITYQTGLFHINERTRGYQSAVEEYKLPFRKSWLKEVGITNSEAEIIKAFHEMTSGPHPVEAILFASSVLAMFGLKQIKSLAMNVPEDVAIVGFDQTDVYALFSTPITHVRQPIQEIGQLAMKILLESLTVNNQITQANLAATLVVQASTQPIATTLIVSV